MPGPETAHEAVTPKPEGENALKNVERPEASPEKQINSRILETYGKDEEYLRSSEHTDSEKRDKVTSSRSALEIALASDYEFSKKVEPGTTVKSEIARWPSEFNADGIPFKESVATITVTRTEKGWKVDANITNEEWINQSEKVAKANLDYEIGQRAGKKVTQLNMPATEINRSGMTRKEARKAKKEARKAAKEAKRAERRAQKMARLTGNQG
jgi:hypothetical protein